MATVEHGCIGRKARAFARGYLSQDIEGVIVDAGQYSRDFGSFVIIQYHNVHGQLLARQVRDEDFEYIA